MKIHAQYDPSAPFDGNVEYGMANAYTLVQALQAAGKKLTRQDVVNAIQNNGAKWTGPGLVPFRYSTSDHGGFGGAEMGQVRGRQDRPVRRSAHHRPDTQRRDHAIYHSSAGTAGERNSLQLAESVDPQAVTAPGPAR